MVVIVTSRKSAANISLEVNINLVLDITLDGMSNYYSVITADCRHISCDIGYFAPDISRFFSRVLVGPEWPWFGTFHSMVHMAPA